MDFEPLTLFLLALVGLAAGCIDAIAGGGGLLTLPALLMAGLPPAAAIATNKLQSWVGTALAVLHYARAGLIDWGALWPFILLTGLGAALGALLVSRLGAGRLEHAIPYVIFAVGLWFLLAPRRFEQASRPRLGRWVGAALIGTGIGFYDGVFGPGTGSFFVLALMLLRGEALLPATAATKVLNLTSNLVALAVFAVSGTLVLQVGLAMAVGQALGGRIGAGLALRRGSRLIRPLLVLVCFGLTLRLILQG